MAVRQTRSKGGLLESRDALSEEEALGRYGDLFGEMMRPEEPGEQDVELAIVLVLLSCSW